MGSGIGLFIVKEILDKMKAGIRVESKLNEGSIFFVTIPNNIIYA
jgi:signal transduction histidine kinase